MKRLTAFLLAVILVVSLSACGTKTATTSTNTSKTETTDVSKLSEEELKENAIKNATKYIKEKYPEHEWVFDSAKKGSTEKVYMAGLREITDVNNFCVNYFGDKTFEEMGIHENTYCVHFSYETDELENEFVAGKYKWITAYVVTDANKFGQEGIDSCYDALQANTIWNAMAQKLSNIFYGREFKPDFELDPGSRKIEFTNLAYFNVRYDENQDIYEYLKSINIAKYKDNYTIVALCSKGTEQQLIECKDMVNNLSKEDKEFLSLFTNIILYTDVEDSPYEYGISGEYFRFFKGLDLKTLDKSYFSAQNFLKPVFDGISTLYEYDATTDELVAVPLK